jgi:hypothetical protein
VGHIRQKFGFYTVCFLKFLRSHTYKHFEFLPFIAFSCEQKQRENKPQRKQRKSNHKRNALLHQSYAVVVGFVQPAPRDFFYFYKIHRFCDY